LIKLALNVSATFLTSWKWRHPVSTLTNNTSKLDGFKLHTLPINVAIRKTVNTLPIMSFSNSTTNQSPLQGFPHARLIHKLLYQYIIKIESNELFAPV